jgi:perosamine synthetase
VIPVFRPSITEEEIQAVREVMESGWLGLGPKTAEFEQEFARYVGARHAVGMSSGTAALHLALHLLELKRGDEVIVPTITFVSTPHSVVYTGATPVFADVCPDTVCIDPRDVERKITPRTRAIMPVHYGGHPCELDALHGIVRGHDIAIVEDAAHACGAEYQRKRIGSLSPLTCFSFHAVKNLACGEGGMVTTDNDDYARLLRELRWLGISKDTWQRTVENPVYAWHYFVNRLGFKAHLNDIAAAIGLVQLRRLEQLNARRRTLVARYTERLSQLSGVQCPAEKPYVRSAWHLYAIQVEDRDELIAYFKERGIAPGVHYYPTHLHPYYRDRKAECPRAEELWKRLLTLPLYPDLREEEQEHIIQTVEQFAQRRRARLAERPRWLERPLCGEHIRLRKIVSADLSKIMAWRNKRTIRRWFFHQEPLTMEQQIAWYNRYLHDEHDVTFIIETLDEKPVGMIALYDIDEQAKRAELGRLLIGERQYQKKGFARDATGLLLNWAFTELGLEEVYLRVFEHNNRAIALYEGCGFETVRIDLEAIEMGGRKYDVRTMRIGRAQFEARTSSKER